MFLALALAGSVALAGCGQKGPLFLPQDVLEKKKKKDKTSAAAPRRATG